MGCIPLSLCPTHHIQRGRAESGSSASCILDLELGNAHKNHALGLPALCPDSVSSYTRMLIYSDALTVCAFEL